MDWYEAIYEADAIQAEAGDAGYRPIVEWCESITPLERGYLAACLEYIVDRERVGLLSRPEAYQLLYVLRYAAVAEPPWTRHRLQHLLGCINALRDYATSAHPGSAMTRAVEDVHARAHGLRREDFGRFYFVR